MSLMPMEMPARGRLLVAQVLQPVGEDDRRLVAGVPVGEVDEVAELLLLHHPVDLGERDLARARSRRGARGRRSCRRAGSCRPPPRARAP